jgi:hypothetical protein
VCNKLVGLINAPHGLTGEILASRLEIELIEMVDISKHMVTSMFSNSVPEGICYTFPNTSPETCK